MRTRKPLILASIAAVVASAAAIWALGSALSAPALRDVGSPPATLHARACSFASASGSTIQGWLSQGSPGRGAVILAHSVRSTRLEMVERAQFLNDAGHSVLLFDAQAHGESAGSHVTFGYLEARDARAAVDHAHALFPGEALGYLGVSQGGAAALLGSSPLPVQALVLESVYPSLREAVIDRVAIRLGPLAPLVAPLLLLQLHPRLGVSPSAIAPIEGISRIRAPLLLIAGDQDRHTRLEESQRLFDAAPEPKTLWIIPGATHQNLHRFATVDYERRILEFLAHTLRSSAAGASRGS